MREVLDRLKAQLMARLPSPDYFGAPVSKLDLGEVASIASATRDYMESELIYKQAMMHDAASGVVENA